MLNLHQLPTAISIHAPLREREEWRLAHWKMLSFQSTLPYGSESSRQKHYTINLFQSTLPYGSDKRKDVRDKEQQISIHAPLRERSIKTNYFSINLSQAFFANRLNSNTQEFYFDVRKLLVSHSSPGCEPKLNYMFHITSHRIILHYFFSCQ